MPTPSRPLRFRDRLLLFLIPTFGAWVIRLLGFTLKIEFANKHFEAQFREQGQPVIYAFWHRWLLIPCYSHRNQGITTLISQHKDGEIIARAISRLGFHSVRGSSTRGGAIAIKGLVRAAQRGSSLAVVPDGPRGPQGTVHPGVIQVAALAQLPILPCGLAIQRAWVMNSWDKFVIPKPFSKVCIVIQEPMFVREIPSKERMQELCGELQKKIQSAEELAQRGRISY